MQEITEQIRALADPENAKFVARLMPQIPPEQILGCRTPPLRALAKSLGTDSDAVQVFLKTLPHAPQKIRVLPYHDLGKNKAQRYGLPEQPVFAVPSPEETAQAGMVFSSLQG